MFHVETDAAQNFGRMTRRDWLRVGFLGLGGLTLGEVARLQAQGVAQSRDTAVLLLFAHGGPSHLETYDMKPDASDEVRGPYVPIQTNVAGIQVCEHLPKHARTAHRYSLIRSCSHDEADHFAGHRRFLSGYGRLKPGTGYESYYPQVGAVANRYLRATQPGLPSALAVGGVVVNGPDYSAGISEGFYSGIYRVPIVQRSLPDASLRVDPQRFDDRLILQRQLDSMRRNLDTRGTMDMMDASNRQAVEVLTNGATRRAFDLSQEDPRVRDRYGPGYGQEVLVARRLVEAGVRFVTVCDRGDGPGSAAHNWDDHAVNWDLLTAMNARLPRYDHIVTTLIDDLFERGLTEKVLLIVTGEFGRTPRLERMDGKIGRDHWPSAMSILVSGGGMRMGQVIGATTRNGERPRGNPLDPHDVLATIYHHLGIDFNHQHFDPTGRPHPLARGEVIRELY
ncbi:MAG: DUF1501 domain-containing protein [Gemmataceae bacterium]|nr:DUF1501 domain-containing protein [Gemmataceae bacterium]